MRSVRDLCRVAYGHVGLDYEDYVESSPEFYRPLEVESLCGDPSKIMQLGWYPKRTFESTIEEMVDAASIG
jgi:GDPmannose 4,6-dehydratase